MSNALNVNFLSTLLSFFFFFLKNCTNLSHPSFCNWAPTACPVLLCDPEGWSPVVVPLLPITAYRLTQNLPHHFHIAVFHCFHCCVVRCVVCFFPSSSILFTLLFSVLPQSFLPSLPFPPTSMPTSLLVLQGAGAVRVLLLCLPRTDVQEIPAQ